MFDPPNLNNAIAAWLNEFAPHGILITDANLVIRGWNRWLEEHSGRAAETLVGVHLFEAFPDLVENEFDRSYCDALHGQTSVLAHRFHKYFLKMPAKPDYDLPEMQQTARVSPLTVEGKVVGTITAIEDVSERVVRERELESSRREAEEANGAKDKFLAMLSHDLRTPLTAILGWTNILRNHAQTVEMRDKALERIRRNAEIQFQLIEQIVDVSRIGTGKFQLETESIEIKDAVELALDALQHLADRKGVRLTRSLPADKRITIVDPKRFQQVIWNLVSNGIKFTPKDGSVSTTLIYEEEGFALKISDSGIGISAEHLCSIFEPLWQAKDSSHGGLGLGLAIAQEVVLLHGGSIQAESSGPGQGSTFVVRMPWAVKSAVSFE